MGIFSAILRILKTMAVGLLMLPRIDHSIMPDGFQWIDSGNLYRREGPVVRKLHSAISPDFFQP